MQIGNAELFQSLDAVLNPRTVKVIECMIVLNKWYLARRIVRELFVQGSSSIWQRYNELSIRYVKDILIIQEDKNTLLLAQV